MKKELVAVILAGGVGNRFFPFSTDKILFPWMGLPFAQYSVLNALPKEISRVVLVTNSRNHEALSAFRFPVPHVTVLQRSPLGMADAILSAVSQIQDCSLLIVNGDDISDPPVLARVVKKAISSKAFGVIPGLRVKSYVPMGYLTLQKGRITKITEKPGAGNEPSDVVAMLGHYIADSNVLIHELQMTSSSDDDIYEKSISSLMNKYDFVLEEHSGAFASLKYPWHVLDANEILLSHIKSHRGKNVEIKLNVFLEGNVFLDDGVRVFENTKIIGPCYIGKNTIVGNNNIIRQSHIGANCVTGFNTDITRSYVGDNCWFHSNYIGDSVLEENVSMGSGAALANLRLDDEDIHSAIQDGRVHTGRNKLGVLVGGHVRIGVNASIMPGIKIGTNSFIGAGVILDKDLPEHSYCIAKSEYTVVRNNKSVAQKDRLNFRSKI